MRRSKPLVEADEAPGETFLSEIREQLAALLRLRESMDEIEAIAKSIASHPPRFVRMAAHGSSDNAATYGVYAFGLLPGWTAVRDSISLSVYYDVELDPRDSLVIGLSQSGSTPDVVERLERARCGGARTLAITNAPQSDLAAVADWVIPLSTGEERAVAATKTYMNELAVLALLCASVAGQGAAMSEDLKAVAGALLPELIASLERDVPSMASAFTFVGRMFVTGRGIEFATAREIALKLVETCRIAATALTSTDFAHGPKAAVDALLPRLGDRARRPWARRPRGRSRTGPPGRRDAGRQRQRRRPHPGRRVPVHDPPRPRGRSCRRCSQSCRGSSSPGRWRRRRDSTPTGRGISDR